MNATAGHGSPTQQIPKVSVCVITYNQEQYIRKCLQSLVGQQTNFDFEIIVGEDCSTDGTRAVVQEFVDRYPRLVRAVFQARNSGGSRNNLEVHAAARGEYVAHVDGDDYALPGKLQAQADVLDRDANCNAVWHRVDYFDDSGGWCSGRTADLSMFPDGLVGFVDAIRLGFIGVHSSLMYRRTARDSIPLDKLVLDIYVTLDLLSKGHGRIIDDVLGRYRVGASGSLSASSHRRIKLLALDHAEHYIRKFPEQRGNFFIWAIACALVDAKNRRRSALDLLYFAARHVSAVAPRRIISNIVAMRRSQVRWRQREKSSS